jgi:Uma2 family endonuclease
MTVVPVTDDEDERAWLAPLPHDREWTVDDLENLPDDGLQYELFDGTLIVSPSPFKPHQRAVLALAVLLRQVRPPELEVFVAPLDFQPTRIRSFQPDVLVVRRDEQSDTKVFDPPVLAVEVLSKSTRAKDLILKREMYASSGVKHYWIFDPAGRPDKAEFVGYELVDATYKEVVRVKGKDTVRMERPFPVEVCPARVAAGD